MDYSGYTDLDLMALCIYREARGETSIGRRGVGWVIKNRASEPGWWGKDIRTVVLKPYQFSSFNANDPNSQLVPNQFDHTWLACRLIASGIMNGSDDDITNAANFYHDISMGFPATWGDPNDFQKTLATGRLIFYRFKPVLSRIKSAIDQADFG